MGGHRGLRLEYPDNTIEGILAAREAADLVELDTRRSADGRIVLSHDPEIDGRVVCQTTWDELRTIDLGSGLHPALLDDLLDVVGEFPLDIEIKNDPAGTCFDASLEFPLEVATRARPQDMVTSFHWPTMHAIHRTYPNITTGLLVDPLDRLVDAASTAVEYGHRAIAPHWSLLGDSPNQAVHSLLDRGLIVVVWTVDDDDLAVALAEAGVQVIITDDPKRIARKLKEDVS